MACLRRFAISTAAATAPEMKKKAMSDEERRALANERRLQTLKELAEQRAKRAVKIDPDARGHQKNKLRFDDDGNAVQEPDPTTAPAKPRYAGLTTCTGYQLCGWRIFFSPAGTFGLCIGENAQPQYTSTWL